MQTCLSFRDEAYPCPALVGVWNEATVHCRSAHLRLLGSLPPVWMAEHKLNVMLDRAP